MYAADLFSSIVIVFVFFLCISRIGKSIFFDLFLNRQLVGLERNKEVDRQRQQQRQLIKRENLCSVRRQQAWSSSIDTQTHFRLTVQFCRITLRYFHSNRHKSVCLKCKIVSTVNFGVCRFVILTVFEKIRCGMKRMGRRKIDNLFLFQIEMAKCHKVHTILSQNEKK